jgi:Ser/Thr protein kinase RdoA (MazF antagonist)
MNKESSIVNAAVKDYSLGSISNINELEAKGERKVYKVTTEQGTYVVKATAPNDIDKVKKDIFILKYLEQFSFPAPHLLKTSQGDTLTYLEDRAVYAYKYIEGNNPIPSIEYFTLLGKLLAQLHTLPIKEYPYQSDFTPEHEFPKLIDNLKKIKKDDQNEDIAKLLEDIKAFPVFKNLSNSIIHTDPYFSNIIQNGNRIFLVDLDDAGVAPAIIDVGYVLAHCCTTEPGDREELRLKGEGIMWHQEWAESFLKGYREVRSLSQEEMRYLPDAARFAMLVYITDWEKENSLSSSRFQRYKLISEHVPLLK